MSYITPETQALHDRYIEVLYRWRDPSLTQRAEIDTAYDAYLTALSADPVLAQAMVDAEPSMRFSLPPTDYDEWRDHELLDRDYRLLQDEAAREMSQLD